MKENIYTLLMRKYIIGITTDEEDDVLFDWLDKDERHFNYLTWFSAFLNSAGEPFQKALIRDNPDDPDCLMTDEEVDELLTRYLRVMRKQDNHD